MLTEIVQSLVYAPEMVTVEVVKVDRGTVVRLRVADRDLGTVMGREARTVRSLQTILSHIGKKANRRLFLEIVGRRNSRVSEEY
jgi:uncharacterized protein